ncbi:unnamed protein product, partial [Discosporangium mesarthrocarpum]
MRVPYCKFCVGAVVIHTSVSALRTSAARWTSWVTATMSSSSLEGKLFIYSRKKRLAAFQSGCHHKRYAVFVPGLTDGLLSVDYVPALAEVLERLGFSFVTPVLSSSYQGYGTSSLRQDVEELDELLSHITGRGTTEGRGDVLLIGHSTGCQDAVAYMREGSQILRGRVCGVVLQAPVSDRESRAMHPGTADMVELARSMAPGDLMPREAEEVPITAQRYLSLTARGGDDDMFSSDLTPRELSHRIGHM